MNKSRFFSGQPVFAQLLGLIPDWMVRNLVQKHEADRYYKKFKTWDHLVAMLYCCFHNCTSLREVVTGMEASDNKLSHLGITSIPRRSTLSDANSSRPEAFFADLYHGLYKLFSKSLPDSRKASWKKKLLLMDSTTVTLFSDVMKGAGAWRADGRKKGGVKAHVLYNASNGLPQFIHLSESARNDRIFMSELNLNKGDTLAFDKGYQNFAQWQKWTEQGVNWVTRLIGTESYRVLEEKPVSQEEQKKGVCQDSKILLGAATGPTSIQITVRLISFYVAEHKKVYHFLTNNFRMKASAVAWAYERRWEVEVFFKRFKKNNPLQYFLGDNEVAIQIQMWCAFIKDLLIKIVQDQLQRKWSFSNLTSMIRHHLMNYIDLLKFLNNPEKLRIASYKIERPPDQLLLFKT